MRAPRLGRGAGKRSRVKSDLPNLPYLFHFRQVRMRQMKMKIGDKVRSTGGVEGEIVSRSTKRRSVMVKVPGIWLSSGIVSIPLSRLKFISGYSAGEFPPLHGPPNDVLGIFSRRLNPPPAGC